PTAPTAAARTAARSRGSAPTGPDARSTDRHQRAGNAGDQAHHGDVTGRRVVVDGLERCGAPHAVVDAPAPRHAARRPGTLTVDPPCPGGAARRVVLPGPLRGQQRFRRAVAGLLPPVRA